MRKKEFNELKTKSKKELGELVETQKVELIQITGKIYAGKEKNLKKGNAIRRNIAQILTVLSSQPEEKVEKKETDKKEKKS